MANNFASDYNDVNARLVEFREKHPDGSLQPADSAHPFEIVTVGDKTFVAYTAAAYRSPEDPRPGIGCAWEPLPGKTNFTRDSELQNAETSAWGRAIVAALAADTKKGIASAEEIRNRRAEREEAPKPSPMQEARDRVWAAAKHLRWDGETLAADYARENGGEIITNASTDQLNEYAIRLEVSTPDVVQGAA